MLRIPGTWVWDSWPVEDGPDRHLFFLRAPATDHPDGRHHRASIGHAVSPDWVTWTVLPDALTAAPGPAWDDLATWTGSVFRGPDGTWHLFYSALSRADKGRVQRIGRADSRDLITWERFGGEPLVEADPRWYETLGAEGSWPEQAWRDPYVIADPGGDGWHMLITARARTGESHDRGVIGHAWSPDLATWEVRPPLTERAGFGQLEVPSVTKYEDQWLLLFCCLPPELAPERRKTTSRSGMWSAPARSPLGPFDLQGARPFHDPTIYAAHLVDRGMLGFRIDPFEGEIPAPIPLKDQGLRE